LHYLLSSESPDIVCVSETWFNCEITDSCVLSNYPYNINRSDRIHFPGGGVCILNKRDSVNVVAVSVPQHVDCFDIRAVDTVGGATPVRFITVCRPPSSDTDIDAVAAVRDLIKYCLNKLCSVDYTVV